MAEILAERVFASGGGDNPAVDTQAGDGRPDARAQGAEGEPGVLAPEQPEPAPPPRCEEDGPSAAGAAEGAAPVVVIDIIGGMCPIQADGTIGGLPFYFRARGTHWELWVADKLGADPLEQPHKYYEEHYGAWPSAGYMTEAEARGFIHKGAAALRGKP